MMDRLSDSDNEYMRIQKEIMEDEDEEYMMELHELDINGNWNSELIGDWIVNWFNFGCCLMQDNIVLISGGQNIQNDLDDNYTIDLSKIQY